MKVKVWFVEFYSSRYDPFLYICWILPNLITNIFKWVFNQFFNIILFWKSGVYQQDKKKQKKIPFTSCFRWDLQWKIFFVAQPWWPTFKIPSAVISTNHFWKGKLNPDRTSLCNYFYVTMKVYFIRICMNKCAFNV